MVKVGFASADWSLTVVEEDGTPCMGGSGWIRIGQYSKYLKTNHVIGTLIYSKDTETFGVTDTSNKHHLDCDIIYMQRWMMRDIPNNIRKAQANGQIIINDLDDWYWGLHYRHRAKNVLNSKNNTQENSDFYRQILSLSDLVVVSTPFLVDRAKTSLGVKNLALSENCVDFDAYAPFRRKHNDGPIVVGWHGSTGHRSGDLDCLRGVYSSSDPEQFSFHHTGHNSGNPLFWEEVDVDQSRVSLYPMVSPTQIPRMLTFDIGVAPLTDIPFNHAKSWIKPLEYIAAGVPFIASKISEYTRLQQQYGVGRLAKKFIDWKKHLEFLSDVEVRQSEALANLEAVKSLDVRRGALRLDEILESVIK